MNKAQKKVLKDIEDLKEGEHKRMYNEPRRSLWGNIVWKARSIAVYTEYWIVAFALPISIIIWLVSRNFLYGLAFWAVIQVYCFSANIRGLTLHLEGLIEAIVKKTI